MKHLFLTLSLVLAIQSIQPLFAQEQEAVDKPLFERGPKDDEYIAAFMADSDVRRLRYSAENGDAFSQVTLADMFRQKVGPYILRERELPIVMKLYVDAMQKNYAPAFLRVAAMIQNGELPESKPFDAFGYYKQAAELGDAEGLRQYAALAFDRYFCSRCERKEIGSFRMTGADVVFGSGKADFSSYKEAGSDYRKEKLSMVTAAITLLEKQEIARHTASVEMLNSVYLDGIKVPAVSLYFTSAAAVDNEYLLEPQPVKARKLMESIAATGDPWANKLLALNYILANKPGWTKDPVKFLTYMERAAKSGDVEAQKLLGHELVAGNNVPLDLNKGEHYVRLAHDGGDIDATIDLGVMYMDGRGLPKDEERAVELLTGAADRGSAKAAEYAATLWETGVNGTRNPMRAYVLREQAKRNAEQEKKKSELREKLEAISSPTGR